MLFLSLLFPLYAAATPDLNGTWEQSCMRAHQRIEEFSGTSALYTERNFRDGACAQPVVDILSRGTLVPGEEVQGLPGISELDFIFESVSLLPRDVAAAAYYDRVALCGLTGWKSGEARDITGLSCDFFGQGGKFTVPAAGLRKFGIVKREGESLFLGRLSPERDASSPARRPRELDPLPYLKQP